MKICPECREECENFEAIGRILREMIYCPECGVELQDKDEYECNEAINEAEDMREEELLQDRLEANNERD